jgi:hypothetical protein
MMLLAISSPLLGIGLVMYSNWQSARLMLRVFETWALGGPNGPAHHSQQPHGALAIQAPGAVFTPLTDQMPPVDAGAGTPCA